MTLEEQRLLLERIHRDPKTFGELFDEYYTPIFGYVFRRTADYDLSRDLAADTFLQAFIHIHAFRWRGLPLSAWLYRIANNEVNKYYRRNKLLNFFDLKEHLPQLNYDNDYHNEKQRLEAELQTFNDFIEVQKHLKTLPNKYQEVIALRFFESKSIHDVAIILNKNEGTVKSLLSRGIDRLRKLMNAT